ncbi:MAG: hypothetical protein [Caudoviricetes sp.]|nr:MAG: hypothetical protein [Caudoviricetes sp.]
MKKPALNYLVYDDVRSETSNLALRDFDVLQQRLKIFFPKAEMKYRIVSTIEIRNWITGISIEVEEKVTPTVKAEFCFAVFPLLKFNSKNEHLIRYRFYIDENMDTDDWLSLADYVPSPDSLNATLARDIVRAHSLDRSLFL